MRIGYARVSTGHQSLPAQDVRLRGVGVKKVHAETFSGTTANRPQWEACLKALREDDHLMVTRLDRIGRSLKDLLAIHDDLNERGVSLQVLDQAIDTSSSMGKMIFGVVSAVAEYEASLVADRTRTAMQARLPGKRGGRKPVMTKTDILRARQMKDANILTMPKIAGELRVNGSEGPADL